MSRKPRVPVEPPKKESLPQLSTEKINEVLGRFHNLENFYPLVYSTPHDGWGQSESYMYDIGEELFLVVYYENSSYGNKEIHSIRFTKVKTELVTKYEPII